MNKQSTPGGMWGGGARGGGRVVVHADLDCFYCQVEQKRLGIPREEGLIAINYAARALGITRHMRVKEALQKCPELKCVHVQTVGGETGKEGSEGAVNGGAIHPANRALQKASLERYRRASTEILALFRKLVPEAKMEKASIDEVYLDVTSIVEKELAEREDSAAAEHAAIDAFAWNSIVEGGPLDTESEYDRRLSAGAAIACRLRGAVREQLGFTCSAGIAQNKLLAKIGSARNKPDAQTIVTARGIPGLMKDLPLKKLRNFGGKLGAELQAMGASTAGEVAALPPLQLQQRFGADRAQWILECVRGTHDEPVTERERSKSMLAAKSFEATSDGATLARWLGVLAEELAERLVTDAEENRRQPRLLVLSYRQKDTPASRSKSVAMPRGPSGPASAAQLAEAGLAQLQRCPDALPCCNLGLTAADFHDVPADGGGIARFLQPKASGAASPPKGEGRQQKVQSPPKLTRAAAKPTIDRLFRKAACKRHCEEAAGPQSSSRLHAANAASGSSLHRDSAANSGGTAAEAAAAEPLAAQGAAGVAEAQQPAAQSEGQAAEQRAEDGLEGVDVGEQQRIMREIWLRQSLQKGGGKSKKAGQAAPMARPGQPRLTDMFKRR